MKSISNDKILQAYIIGLSLGDGNLSNPNGRCVRLRISCDTKYPSLLKKIQISLLKLFPNGKISVIKRKSNCIDVSCYSNLWPNILGWSTLSSKFQQNVGIPSWVKADHKYVIPCLRGLIETDGSIYTDRGYIMVLFTSIIPNLANDYIELVKKLGFSPTVYVNTPKKKFNSQKAFRIRISKETKKFIELIGPEKK